MFSSVYFCWLLWSSILFTLSKKYYHSTEACHVLYNVQLYDKCENEWKDLCCNTKHLFLGQADLCLDIWHNIKIYISSVVTRDLTVDMHTFFPLPYHIIWRKYDAHVAWLYFYMFHIRDLFFPQTLFFENFGWDPWFFLITIPPWQ